MSTDNIHERKAVKEQIDIHDPSELRKWSNKYGITKEQLMEAVIAVGNLSGDIEKFLSKQEAK